MPFVGELLHTDIIRPEQSGELRRVGVQHNAQVAVHGAERDRHRRPAILHEPLAVVLAPHWQRYEPVPHTRHPSTCAALRKSPSANSIRAWIGLSISSAGGSPACKM